MKKIKNHFFRKQQVWILFVLLFVPIFSYSQIDRQSFNGNVFGVYGGVNFSKFDMDSIQIFATPLFNAGISVEREITTKFSVRLAGGYAQRGCTSMDNYFEFKNEYIDIQAQARLYLGGNRVKLTGGIQRSNLLTSRVKVYDDAQLSSYAWSHTEGLSSQLEVQAGLSIALYEAIDLETHLRIPGGKADYSTIQCGLVIYLSDLGKRDRLMMFNSIEEAMENPFMVEKLVLQRQGLTEIPKEVYSFPYLEELVLDGNDIKSIDPNIGNLKHLRLLSVKFNELTELPSEIGKLENLEELSLENNQLKHLPPEIGNLEKLKFLYVGKNSLEDLPEELGNLISLVELDLSNSGVLLSIPSTLQNLQKLEWLIIDKNVLLPYSASLLNPRVNIVVR